ncbi:HNH endonuclease [Planotetraspora sp. GP83]|uniref:HNH endonuclease n=1 Tax=Planotetraspora sp. GP83 TaxID=3156264 RepID=UPI0035129965
MGLSDLRHEMVLAALEEHDELGRDAFLDQYGYRPARDYFLIHEGRRYDSKAIAGVAHRGVTGRPLRAAEFSGGNITVARALSRLGFTVTTPGQPLPEDPVELLLHKVANLETAISPQTHRRKRHQPLTLLWALGRAAQGQTRLVSWPVTRQEISELITTFGLDDDAPNPEYPVLKLTHFGLWELPGQQDPPAASGNLPIRWMRQHQPASGLLPWVHDLVMREVIRARAVALLLNEYFTGVNQEALLTRVGLTPSADTPPLQAETPAPPQREVTGMRVIRDSALARLVKDIHDHRCQICGTRLALREGYYAEAAHIRPVGSPHDGPDERSNLLCLCPNDHALFDRGAILIQNDFTMLDALTGATVGLGSLRRMPEHVISRSHLAYHRKISANP